MDGDDGANTSRVWSWKFQDGEDTTFGPDRVNSVYLPDGVITSNVTLDIDPDVYEKWFVTKEDIYTEFTKYFPYDDPDYDYKFRL